MSRLDFKIEKMKTSNIKYPIFMRASKYTLCPLKKNFLYSCSEGNFPQSVKYEPHYIKFGDQYIELSNSPTTLCLQMINIFELVAEENYKKNISRSVYDFTISQQEKYKMTETKRKELFSLIMMGVILKTINKNNITYKGSSIVEIDSLIIEDKNVFYLDMENFQSGSSIKSR